MKIIGAILAMMVVALSSYSLITANYEAVPLIQLLLGVMLLIWGASRFQENRKVTAILLLLTSVFVVIINV